MHTPTTLARLANVDESTLNNAIEHLNQTLEINIDLSRLDQGTSGLIADHFGVRHLNEVWWLEFKRVRNALDLIEGASPEPQETPEYAAWQKAKHEYLWRPTPASDQAERDTKEAYLNCPQYQYVRKGRPPLPPKPDLDPVESAFRAVDRMREVYTPPTPERRTKALESNLTEKQLKRREYNHRAYEKLKSKSKS